MDLNKIHPDQKYIDGLAANDSVVIEMIYKKFAPKVVQFITNNSGDKDQAQNVVHEIMILLFRQAKAGKLHLTCPFDAYFFLLCKRRWLNELKNSVHKEVTIYENVVSVNESAHKLIAQAEEFEKEQKRYGHENELEVVENRVAFEENLIRISDKYFNKKKHKVASLKPWYFAAVISIIVMFGLFFFDYKHNPSFEDYNHPESAYFTERGVSEAILKQAENNFNRKRYETAIPIFEMILKENNSDEIKYFYAVSLLQVNKYPKAEKIFKELEDGNSVYKEKAKWNMALSKLKQGKYKECKTILETISQDYEDYDDVERLREDLE
ncbi:tetratricopeptide repeat protein [Flavobacterium ginsenosidimutans]|uniref:tetratricopeptide repeat protein n=1 Tax=Flavobacterium ginsenosidimutans TaxID=687844 RepID=UPI003D956EE1